MDYKIDTKTDRETYRLINRQRNVLFSMLLKKKENDFILSDINVYLELQCIWDFFKGKIVCMGTGTHR